jgi:large subunit ribosomal protein L13
MTERIVIDATGGVLGRIAAFAAKQALLGKDVAIVNCEHAAITGRPRKIIEGYQQKRAWGGTAQKGPYFPKNPERLMKRTVRGMLSHSQLRGRTAFKRIVCYNSVPAEYQNAKKITLTREIKTKSISLSRLNKEL